MFICFYHYSRERERERDTIFNVYIIIQKHNFKRICMRTIGKIFLNLPAFIPAIMESFIHMQTKYVLLYFSCQTWIIRLKCLVQAKGVGCVSTGCLGVSAQCVWMCQHRVLGVSAQGEHFYIFSPMTTNSENTDLVEFSSVRDEDFRDMNIFISSMNKNRYPISSIVDALYVQQRYPVHVLTLDTLRSCI